jgi:putative chitobiose transport system permease protein
MNWIRFKRSAISYLFLFVPLLLLGIFTFMPVILGTALSVYQYDIISPPEFVGLQNFKELMQDRHFLTALTNSVKYLMVVPILQFLSILLAIAVNQKLRGIRWFRAAYYIPVVTSMVVVGIMWRWLYEPEGLVSFALMKLGLIRQPISWLGNPDLALYAVMFVTLWKGLGYYMVIYLAGLQQIPKELEEAAMVDGCSRWQIFTHITLPMLRPSILICSTISTIAAIKVFEEIYVMTGGGPMSSTLTLFFYIFDKGFQQLQLGYAAAIAVVLAAVTLIPAIINFMIFRRGGMEAW